jgi:hypothetical protein
MSKTREWEVVQGSDRCRRSSYLVTGRRFEPLAWLPGCARPHGYGRRGRHAGLTQAGRAPQVTVGLNVTHVEMEVERDR